jgi:predicted nucleic acid-binding protein
VIRRGEGLIKHGYSLAAKSHRSIYDAIFIALALELTSDLATFDKRQAELLQKRDRKVKTQSQNLFRGGPGRARQDPPKYLELGRMC